MLSVKNNLTLKLMYRAYGKFQRVFAERKVIRCSYVLAVVLVAWLKKFEAFCEGIIANFAVFLAVVGDFRRDDCCVLCSPLGENTYI